MTANDFGATVKKKLIDTRMTQKALAKELGVSASFLNAVLNGHRPGVLCRRLIAEFLGLPSKMING
jgi:transcriptional regulator with XRE-family HTH domain